MRHKASKLLKLHYCYCIIGISALTFAFVFICVKKGGFGEIEVEEYLLKNSVWETKPQNHNIDIKLTVIADEDGNSSYIAKFTDGKESKEWEVYFESLKWGRVNIYGCISPEDSEGEDFLIEIWNGKVKFYKDKIVITNIKNIDNDYLKDDISNIKQYAMPGDIDEIELSKVK